MSKADERRLNERGRRVETACPLQQGGSEEGVDDWTGPDEGMGEEHLAVAPSQPDAGQPAVLTESASRACLSAHRSASDPTAGAAAAPPILKAEAGKLPGSPGQLEELQAAGHTATSVALAAEAETSRVASAPCASIQREESRMFEELRKLKHIFDGGTAPVAAGMQTGLDEVGQQELSDMQMAARLQREEFDTHRKRTAFAVHATTKKVPRVNTLDAFVRRKL